jgi:hypothetical protein
MRKIWWMFLFSWMSALSLSGCANGGLFCDPNYQHCGGNSPQTQNEIADEVGQML